MSSQIPMTPDPWLTPTPEPEMNAPSSPLPPSPKLNIPPTPPSMTCNCRSGCSSTRCKCYKSGRGCLPSPSSGCKCESCINMLNDLSFFFGSPKSSSDASTTVNVTASPDFLKWIRRETRNGRFDLIHPDTMEELRSMLMGVEYGDILASPTHTVFSSGKLRGIKRAWTRADITDDEREDAKKELFKEAFGIVEGEQKKNYWCFCKNVWRKTVRWSYCLKCDECRAIRERHCE